MKSPMRSDATSLQQNSEYAEDEAQADQYMVDRYPYGMRGLLWGFLFSIVFWGSAIAILILMLVF